MPMLAGYVRCEQGSREKDLAADAVPERQQPYRREKEHRSEKTIQSSPAHRHFHWYLRGRLDALVIRLHLAVDLFKRNADVWIWKPAVEEGRERIIHDNRVLDEPRRDHQGGTYRP